MAKILIVDDYKEVIAVLEHRLEALGHEVTSVDLAMKAIALMRQDSFDLVISDVVMPGMNGVEFMNSVSTLPGQLRT